MLIQGPYEEYLGYAVLALVATGEEAILLVESLQPDLVLMDFPANLYLITITKLLTCPHQNLSFCKTVMVNLP